jgi:hypothetical protein
MEMPFTTTDGICEQAFLDICIASLIVFQVIQRSAWGVEIHVTHS